VTLGGDQQSESRNVCEQIQRYFFKLYALDAELQLKARATKKELARAMEGHILAEGQLMGTYNRK
jgi:phosphatidylethanolamine-binding protein (PEBP) family uncharacterized protein